MASPKADILLSIPEVRVKLQCSYPDFIAMQHYKSFPEPSVLKAHGAKFWFASVVDQWVRDNKYKPRKILTRTHRPKDVDKDELP